MEKRPFSRCLRARETEIRASVAWERLHVLLYLLNSNIVINNSRYWHQRANVMRVVSVFSGTCWWIKKGLKQSVFFSGWGQRFAFLQCETIYAVRHFNIIIKLYFSQSGPAWCKSRNEGRSNENWVLIILRRYIVIVVVTAGEHNSCECCGHNKSRCSAAVWQQPRQSWQSWLLWRIWGQLCWVFWYLSGFVSSVDLLNLLISVSYQLLHFAWGIAEAKCILVTAVCVSVPRRIPTLLHGPSDIFIPRERTILLVFCLPTVVGGRCPLSPLMGDRSDPPPSKVAHIDRFPPVTSQQ